MKKNAALFLLIVMVCSVWGYESNTVFAQNDIIVTVNGTTLSFDQPPIIKDGRTLVPLRAIFEALGAEVTWFESQRGLVAKKGDTQIAMQIGLNRYLKDVSGQRQYIDLDVPPEIVNDRTLVPARAVAEALDCTVDWDETTRTVIITSAVENVVNADKDRVLKGSYTTMSNTSYNTTEAFPNACCAYIYNGTVYYSLVYQPVIYAFDGTNTVTYNTGGAPSGIVVTGNKLYYLNENDMNICSIDLQTGAIEILFAKLSTIESFLIYNGVMYISGTEESYEGDRVYQVDLNTGVSTVIFNSEGEDLSGLALTVKNGKLYLLSLKGVYSIDCESGVLNYIFIDEMRGYRSYKYIEDENNLYIHVVAFETLCYQVDTANDTYKVIAESEYNNKAETVDSGDGYSYHGENSSITRTNVANGEVQTLIAANSSKNYNYLANNENIVVFWSGNVQSRLVASADQYSGAIYSALSHTTNGYASAEIYVMNTDGSGIRMINAYGDAANAGQSFNSNTGTGGNAENAGNNVISGTGVCDKCGGSGMIICTVCGGSGKGPDMYMLGQKVEQGCVTCGSTGKIPCTLCGGSGAQ